MKGRKSIIKKFIIDNIENPKRPHWVFVQANKNHGICNIILSEKDKGITRLSEVLSQFQGQQYNSESVQESLTNVLFNTLNK